LGKRVKMPDGRVLDILSAIDMQVNAGEAVAILGPSGSGKSTLLGLLAGLDQPSEGRVSLLGQDLGGLDEDARAALRAGRVGFVFQSFQLLPGMTALENVALPLQIGRNGAARALAGALLREVGLGEQ
jgi:putative ABC transport system ATP-binding protein